MKSKSLKRMICSLVSLTLVLSLFVPAAVNAAWEAPTTPMTVSNNIAKIGVHAAAGTAPMYLGGNVVTERASDYRSILDANPTTSDGNDFLSWIAPAPETKLQKAQEFTRLAVFGSDKNASPDPYIWNFFYNCYANANGKTPAPAGKTVQMIDAGSPASADRNLIPALGTSYTLSRRPDVLLGIANTTATDGYDDLIGQLPENNEIVSGTPSPKPREDWVYDPVQVPYKMATLYELSDSLYDLADGMKASGKTGRYGDPLLIAQKYEKYLRGLQLYVLKMIEEGKVKKKTVAIVEPGSDGGGKPNGKYKVYLKNMSNGTAASCRGAEYVENTTNNIIQTLNLPNIGTETSPDYEATAEQLTSADCINIRTQTSTGASIEGTSNISAEDMKSKLIEKGANAAKVPPIYANFPASVFGMIMNSVENIQGLANLQGFIYPEIIDPMQCSMYLYETFWHITDRQNLLTMVNANYTNATLAAGAPRQQHTYNKAAIETILKEGMYYYAANKSKFANTNLAYSNRVTVESRPITPPPAKPTVKKATLSKVTSPKAKTLKVTWKKDATATGYQVVIALDSKFKKGKKTANITQNTTLSKTFKGLKKGKKYYVKVRAYKTVKGTKYYGAWSKVKTVKVKKK